LTAIYTTCNPFTLKTACTLHVVVFPSLSLACPANPALTLSLSRVVQDGPCREAQINRSLDVVQLKGYYNVTVNNGTALLAAATKQVLPPIPLLSACGSRRLLLSFPSAPHNNANVLQDVAPE